MAIISIEKTVEKLRAGRVVALPTETVYGLAGLINNQKTLELIFSTKNRPFFDPLIVHVQSLEQAKEVAQWDQTTLALAEHFWPGPLTVVLPKKTKAISDLITNAGPTVALRCPSHKLFQQVLAELPCPVAAPSANRFGKTSPTTAEHVIDEFLGEVDVLDGGACQQGIESTIVEWDQRKQTLKVLRPGMISEDQLKSCLDHRKLPFLIDRGLQSNAPGHLKNHYQPEVPLFLIDSTFHNTDHQSIASLLAEHGGSSAIEWILPTEPSLAARQLYVDMRKFSQNHQPVYLIRTPAMKNDPAWAGVSDRLEKACHFFLNKCDGQWLIQPKDS